MINDKTIIDGEDDGDFLRNNAVPLPNAGSSVLQNMALGSLGSSDGINIDQKISPWLQKQHSSISQGNVSSSSGGSLLAGLPISDLKKEQRRDWQDNNGRGNRPKKNRQRNNERQNRKKGNRGSGRDFRREDIFGNNDRQRGGRNKKRGNKKMSLKADWAKALGSYPVVSSGMLTSTTLHISYYFYNTFNLSIKLFYIHFIVHN